MTQEQIDYYTGLSESEKTILKVAALKAYSFSEYHITELHPRKVTQKHVKECLSKAVKFALFRKAKSYRNDFSVSLEFMLYIYPELSGYKHIWKRIMNEYDELYTFSHFRNCLYTLLHIPDDYTAYEQAFALNLTSEKIGCYSILIQEKQYEHLLHLINPDLLNIALASAMNAKVHMLESLPEMKRFCDTVQRSHTSDAVDASFIDREILLQSGRFEQWLAMSDKNAMQRSNVEAIHKASLGETGEAFAIFEKALKAQRKMYRDSFIPNSPLEDFYYLATLLSIDQKTAIPIFRKMELRIAKNSEYGSSLPIFAAIIYHVLNMKEMEIKELEVLKGYILNTTGEGEYIRLISVLIYYMTGHPLEAGMSDVVFTVVQKAKTSGYLILAYEAAYAMKSWFGDERSSELFNEVAAQFSYQPVLSRITHREDWEKSLNMLMGLKIAAAKTAKNGESKSRIVYLFNPRNNTIQPVLQTRQAKGWTAGRNIALKSFYECKCQGMTPQDLLIAKMLKHTRDYYGDFYEFTNEVYPQLIGHPYIFLEGRTEIPVEFVAAQPLINVSRTAKGYVLSADIPAPVEKIVLRKETNTRYLVFSLSPQQQQILQIIATHLITVPERGKEKLIELLWTLSAQGLDVHSDLLTSDSMQAQAKEVPTDSRIRVQLLPWGNGLKAELFCKPFGTHPPYCKPGKGGKVLIANENNLRLQVKRDLKKELKNENTLLADIQSIEGLEMSDELIAFDNPLDSLFLLECLKKHQEICVVEWPEGERFRIRGAAESNRLRLKLKSGVDWLDLQGELKVDEQTVLTLPQLLDLTAKSHNHFIELNEGEFLMLSYELKRQLDELRLFADVGKQGVKINKFASIALNDFFEQTDIVKTDKLWKQFRDRVNAAATSRIDPPAHLEAELRDYQKEGFRWLVRLSEWGAGACLADDMGLGKTIQTLALLLNRAPMGPAMAVCPVSVVGNWINEAERFAPTLQIKTLPAASGNRKEQLDALEAGDLLIISYGLMLSEIELLAEIPFATLVLDEAHTIKNYTTKTSKASMQLKADFRIALTGTPLQNHLGEIWNIFHFINPGLLGSMQHFSDTFIKADDEKTRKHLKRLISPFLLRRSKTSVLDELPPKTEIVKRIQLSDEETTFYENLRRQAIENLNGSAPNNGSKHLRVLAEITRLRQASCNPRLIDPESPIASSKLSAFLEIVDELRENKHRALVFSQFVTHLSIVREVLDKQGIPYRYLDGAMPAAEREQNVKMFQNGHGDLFLISLKAGGLGLNLTAADFVIHLDPWWNPAIEDQASDRAHRMGQTRPVTIYRLVAEHTIEEKIIELHKTKRNLAEYLFEGADQAVRLSLDDLIELIRDKDR
ncbi:MAG: DEAD/DEAH box helicase [Tannerellaceae bacterium]|jgi:SNF2 family DNA or RNA helicase|nr:DEAD/DEAH box helicase [Tannerellaceae bacterium]